jgi:hypothetical protein
MSLMDTAQLLGNLGEFIGAIVIVATLIYLAMQVRQNTNALHAQSRQAIVSAAQTEIHKLMENPDILKAFAEAGSLTSEEQAKIGCWLGAAMRVREFSWLQYQNGVIDEAQWSTERGIIQGIFQAHVPRAWWESLGRQVFGAEFVSFVDDLLRDQPISNEIAKMQVAWMNHRTERAV